MRMRLRVPGQVPYGGGYTINRPDLGMVGVGTVFDMLERSVRAYRRANAIPTGLGFSEELETEICKLYPAEAEMTDTVLPLNRRLTLDDVISGTKVIAAFKASGSPLVSKEEATRRGAICSKCKLCQPFPKPCNGLCGGLKTIVDSVIGGYSTEYDDDPRACSICHCFYSSHIRIPYQFLEKGLNDQERAQFTEAHKLLGCWKVPGAV